MTTNERKYIRTEQIRNSMAREDVESCLCEACKGNGWLICSTDTSDYLSIQRCDSCQAFDHDLQAAIAFFTSAEGKHWQLHGEILIEQRA